MPRFRFRAVADSGELLTGEMEAESRVQVVEHLRGQGHLPLAAEAVGASAGTAGSIARWLRQPLFGAGRVGRRDAAIMTRELATLLDAGLTLDEALRLQADLVENPAMRRLLETLLKAIQGGSSFADALARHEAVFSRAYVSMVRAGEAGGSLNEVLARLAAHLDQAETLREQVHSALVYPVILLVMAGLSIIILLTLVLPQFADLFARADAELPLITRAIIGLGEFVRNTWWLMLLVAVGIGLLVRRQWRQPQSRAHIDRWLLRMPLFGDLLVKLDTARFARTLATLLGNGVPLLAALGIVKDTLANTALRGAIDTASAETKEGAGLSQPLARTGRFPKLALQLAAVGERSGRLEPMLMKVAEIYDREVASTIERLMTLLVPVLTISLGLVIALIIGAILAAILSAYQLPL